MHPQLTRNLITLMRNPKTALFGNVLSRLQTVIDPSFEAAAAVRSDGTLIYNPDHEWAIKATDKQVQHILLHEASHILLRHLNRITKEEAADPYKARLFNIAADMALEHLLADISQNPIPEHHAVLEQFMPKSEWGKSMEQIIAIIDTPVNRQAIMGTSLDISKLTSQGAKAIKDAVSKSIGKQAGQMGSGQGSGVGSDTAHSALLLRIMEQHIAISDKLLKPLKHYFQVIYGSKDDGKTEAMLSQRVLLRRNFNGLPLLGRNHGAQATINKSKEEWHNDLTILMDVSGSIIRDDLTAALAFIQRLCTQHDVFPIRVLTFNHDLKQEFEIQDPTTLDSVSTQIKIGGGTNIANALNQADIKSRLTLVFTDMCDTPVTPFEYTPPANNKLLFLAYDYTDSSRFREFTSGDWLDVRALVSKFKSSQ